MKLKSYLSFNSVFILVSEGQIFQISRVQIDESGPGDASGDELAHAVLQTLEDEPLADLNEKTLLFFPPSRIDDGGKRGNFPTVG